MLMKTEAQAEQVIKDHISLENQKHYYVDEVEVYSRDHRAIVNVDTPAGVRIQVSSTDEEV